MSYPEVSSDWTEEALMEQFSESDVTLSEDDIREILNGQADVLDKDRVESLDGYELYQALMDRYRQGDDRAYRRQMDLYNQDLIEWTPPKMDEPKKPAQIIDFRHEVLTNYSRADEGLTKERKHYGAKNPGTGEIIIHMFWDEYVARRQLESGEEEYDE